jgi:hypothetical protein
MTKTTSYSGLGEQVGTHKLLAKTWRNERNYYNVLVLCEFDGFCAVQTIYCEWDGEGFSGFCDNCGTIYELPSK